MRKEFHALFKHNRVNKDKGWHLPYKLRFICRKTEHLFFYPIYRLYTCHYSSYRGAPLMCTVVKNINNYSGRVLICFHLSRHVLLDYPIAYMRFPHFQSLH